MEKVFTTEVPRRAGRVRRECGVRAIVGPTGVGKTAAATGLASGTGAPVLVADRIQCFTDLLVTSGRAADERVEGVNRVWLGDRTVSEGDYATEKAVAELLTRLGSLVEQHRLTVVEGGSISMLLRFAETMDDLPFPVSVQVMPIPDRDGYLARQCARARNMLVRDRSGRSLLTEFVAAWNTPGQRYFTASVSGLDCVLEWCAKHSFPPDEVADIDFPEALLGELSRMMGARYAEHGFIQERLFSEVFGRHV